MFKKVHTISFIVLLLGITLLTGCGFHLRGAAPLPPNIKSISLHSATPYSLLMQELKEIFVSMKIAVVTPTEHPDLILVIDSETFSSTSLVQSASSSTEQYIMYYTITYHLDDAKNQSIWGPKNLRLSQTYSINQNEVLTTGTIEQTIQQQLQQEAAGRIIVQLGSVDAQKALMASSAQPPVPHTPS